MKDSVKVVFIMELIDVLEESGYHVWQMGSQRQKQQLTTRSIQLLL